MMMWRIAYRNLFRNLRRTVATGSAICSGFIGLTLLGGYILMSQNALRVQTVYINHHGHLSIYKKGSVDRFFAKPQKYQITGDEKQILVANLKKFKNEIEFYGLGLSGVGLISNGKKSVPFVAAAIDHTVEDKIRNHPQVLEWGKEYLSQQQIRFGELLEKVPNIISVTPRLGELIAREAPANKLSADDRVVQLAGKSYLNDLNAVDVEILMNHSTGIDFAEDTSVWAPLQVLQDLYVTEGIQYAALYLKDEASMSDLKKGLEKVFKDLKLDFEIFPYNSEAVGATYVGTMSFLYVMGGFFVFLICGVVALSIINSLTIGILERTKEIGTLRAVGFTTETVAMLFVREVLVLAGFCCVLGAIIARIVAEVINRSNVMFEPPGVPYPIQFVIVPHLGLTLVIGFGICAVAAVTGYFVTHVKLKLKIVDLLSDAGA